jgi:hypothetical protein
VSPQRDAQIHADCRDIERVACVPIRTIDNVRGGGLRWKHVGTNPLEGEVREVRENPRGNEHCEAEHAVPEEQAGDPLARARSEGRRPR